MSDFKEERLPVPDRPLVRGEKVWLRALEQGDMAAYTAGVNDTEVGGRAGYRWPQSADQSRAWLERRRWRGKLPLRAQSRSMTERFSRRSLRVSRRAALPLVTSRWT